MQARSTLKNEVQAAAIHFQLEIKCAREKVEKHKLRKTHRRKITAKNYID